MSERICDLRNSALHQRRLSMELVSGFARMALLLTAIGIYGVMASTVAQRAREIGLRLALGAQHHEVLVMIP